MRQTLEQQERSLRWFIKNRWLMTALDVFWIVIFTQEVLQKRWQWPYLLHLSLPPGVPIWHSVWENILGVALYSSTLVGFWLRFYNYRREVRIAEQMALEKDAAPIDEVWPPPPISDAGKEPGVSYTR